MLIETVRAVPPGRLGRGEGGRMGGMGGCSCIPAGEDDTTSNRYCDLGSSIFMLVGMVVF